MAGPRDLRRRIKSIRNTSQITRAMQMVAASRMRKAQQATLAGRPYATLLNGVLAEVTGHAGDFTHPLMERRPVRKRCVILVSTDRGLCGGLNSNLLREAAKLDKDTTIFVAAGKKAAQFIARTRRQLAAEFSYKDNPQFAEARVISRFAQELFLKGEVDRVDILFTNFISTIAQKPEFMPLLPVTELQGVQADVAGESLAPALVKSGVEYLFEPGPEQVFAALLPHVMNYKVYQALLEAKASEHSARMVAMKNATDNAMGLIKDLTLKYNKLRQANITRELLEITTAQMAMG